MRWENRRPTWPLKVEKQSFFTEESAMLVLTRKPGEKIYIDSDITITVLEIKGNKIRIGIEAPDDVTVLRAELRELLGVACPETAESADPFPRKV
jgi:carbon storage regulator